MTVSGCAYITIIFAYILFSDFAQTCHTKHTRKLFRKKIKVHHSRHEDGKSFKAQAEELSSLSAASNTPIPWSGRGRGAEQLWSCRDFKLPLFSIIVSYGSLKKEFSVYF